MFDYIEAFYNRERLHSTLGYRSPEEYEQDHYERGDREREEETIFIAEERRLPNDYVSTEAGEAHLRELSREHPRWGYRRAWASLREEGWPANRKKIQRLWREEGRRVPTTRRRKQQRLGVSTAPAARLRAERPNQVWALDFQFDTTQDGRILKLLHVVDEHTREALAIEVERRIDADRTVSVLERVVAARGRPPELVRMDNGPELTANALRDWCRFGNTGTAYIEPGSPWENPFVESFASPRPRRGARGGSLRLAARGEDRD